MKPFLLPLFLTCALSLNAAIYYASPSGNGDGSSEQKAGNFTSLLKKLKAGDTLYLLAGQYNLEKISLTNAISGTSSQEIMICNAPKTAPRTPILDFRTQAYGERGLQINTGNNYIHIKGLTLRYSGKNALHNSGSHNIFEDLDVYGNADTGVQMKAGGDNMIINVDSHDNCDYKLGGVTAADFGGNADGFADKQYTGGANTYIGCRAWNNSDDGWDFFQRITNGNYPTRLVNCICFRNGPEFYDFTGHGRYQTDKTWFDQFLTTTTITDKRGITHSASISKYPNLGNGNGFKLGGDSTANHVQLEKCLAVGNTVKGFDQNNNYGKMTLYNCSAYLNGMDYGFNNSHGGTLIIRNCISYKSAGAIALRCKSVTSDHNSWNTTGVSVSDKDFLSLDTTVILTERKTDGSLSGIAFMHLKEGSSLIDAGIDVGLEYEGNAPDLGCYEYGSNDSIVIPTPPEQREPDPAETNVAFVTIPNDNRDDVILNRLYQDSALFKVYIRDAEDIETDYSAFSLIVISPVPSSSAAGLTKLKSVEKPTLLLKPFMLKNTVWNWGNSLNTNNNAITLTQPSHSIFKGLTPDENNAVQLFTQVATNGVTAINGWYNCQPDELAVPQSAQGQTIVEAKAGDNMNGTTIGAAFIMIGISEYSTPYLTDDAALLIDNACHYLLGIDPDQQTGTSVLKPEVEDTIPTDRTQSDIIYTILGVPAGDKLHSSSLPAGIYILNGKKIVRH
ncbi:MAG: DUF4990 domain-containing protein [Paludibacteraceae bacterium]|nr:DUF4990 domain-containing protein [Paludibacteraceae bacterium]